MATKTFYAADNEFAAATGSNVYIEADKSRFDYPPNATSNLIIHAQAGDPDPNRFDIGDTYDIEWGGMGGGGTITNATVVRSDSAGAPNGNIVFEGFDGATLVHIIWTPGFDVEQWYWDNGGSSNPPNFYVTDQNPAYTHTYVCFTAGMRIATPEGLRAVETLRPGDRVTTRDTGNQGLRWVGRRVVPGVGRAAPVRFETGVIGNTAPLLLSPQHRVLLTSPEAEMLFGTAEVLLPAKAFLALDGVVQRPMREVQYVHIACLRHEIVWAEGAPCETLLLGDLAEDILKLDRLPGGFQHARAARPILTVREGAALLGKMRLPATV